MAVRCAGSGCAVEDFYLRQSVSCPGCGYSVRTYTDYRRVRVVEHERPEEGELDGDDFDAAQDAFERAEYRAITEQTRGIG